jgi:hypothetical protein
MAPLKHELEWYHVTFLVLYCIVQNVGYDNIIRFVKNF